MAGITAVFEFEDDFVNAARRLRESGFDKVTLMSPLPLESAQEAQGLGKSPVRRFSLAGALLGAAFGFFMASATSMVFILPTGGRAIIPIPPFLVIAYECTILFGVLFTLFGFHVVSRLPAWRDAPYRESANIDRFVVVVETGGDDHSAKAEQIVREAGAEAVEAEPLL